MRSLPRQYNTQPGRVMPARPSMDNLEPNIAQAEALLHAAPEQPAQPGAPVDARQGQAAPQAPVLYPVRQLEDQQQLPAMSMPHLAQAGQENAAAPPAHDADFQLPMRQVSICPDLQACADLASLTLVCYHLFALARRMYKLGMPHPALFF